MERIGKQYARKYVASGSERYLVARKNMGK